MAEWSNALVLKTSILNGIGGSNPSASASGAQNDPDVLYICAGRFFVWGAPTKAHTFSSHKELIEGSYLTICEID